jgi:hypothetical protein
VRQELQTPLAIAIAELENIKSALLETFAWASRPGMITDNARSLHVMNIELARVTLPLIEGQLRKALKILMGNEPPEVK